jgi:site-specific DNA recombinase
MPRRPVLVPRVERLLAIIAEDEAWSGKTVHRPAFQQMLADARAGQFDVVVCHKLDRFSRSLVDVLLTLDELQKYNVTFASAAESIDFTSPTGRMMLVMLAFFAEWYLQNLSAETTKGKVLTLKRVIGMEICALVTRRLKLERKSRMARSRSCTNQCPMQTHVSCDLHTKCVQAAR